MRPFLKWAGNKYRCIETIQHYLPPSNRLIEPFSGSGAVFMNSNYPKYLLAEKNFDLINLYNQIKYSGKAFIEYCNSYFLNNNNQTAFYQLRELFNRSQCPKLRSALFVYLNRHGYNGLCRYNKKRLFNVPFGRYERPYFPENEMLSFYHKSQRATFLCADFRRTFALATPGDIIYCDPPYVPLSKTASFAGYTEQQFTFADHIDLSELAYNTAKFGITVILSNHDTEHVRHLYRFSSCIHSFPVMRSISCKADERHSAQEIIAIFK